MTQPKTSASLAQKQDSGLSVETSSALSTETIHSGGRYACLLGVTCMCVCVYVWTLCVLCMCVCVHHRVPSCLTVVGDAK